jgi:hypothetical protein
VHQVAVVLADFAYNRHDHDAECQRRYGCGDQ